MTKAVAGSGNLFETGERQAIDSTSPAYRAASRNDAKRVGDTHDSVKTTALVDCDTGASLDVHCSMSLPHDTQIAWQVLKRNLSNLGAVVADTGFDRDELRQMLRENGIRPVIKHREFYSLDAAHNVPINDKTCNHRSIVKSTLFALRKRFSTQLKTRTWFGQFREIVLNATVRNLEQSLTT